MFTNRSSPSSYAVQRADDEVASAYDRGTVQRSAIVESNSATPLSVAVGSPIEPRSSLSAEVSVSDNVFHYDTAPQSVDAHETLNAASRSPEMPSQHDANVPTAAGSPWLESSVPPQSEPALSSHHDSDDEELPDGSPQSLAVLLEQQRISMSNAAPARRIPGAFAWPESRKPDHAVSVPSAADQALLRGLAVPAAAANGLASSQTRSGRKPPRNHGGGSGAAERGLGLEAWLNGHLGQNAHVRDLHALQAAAKRAAAISGTQAAADLERPREADGSDDNDCDADVASVANVTAPASTDAGVLHDRRNLQALSIDRPFLLASGVSTSLVDRIYRALYVYSAGLFEVFGEISQQVAKSKRHLVCLSVALLSFRHELRTANSKCRLSCSFCQFYPCRALLRSTLACGRPSPS